VVLPCLQQGMTLYPQLQSPHRKLVVKQTFLEVECRSVSTDSNEEISFSRRRASSDSKLFENRGICDEDELMQPHAIERLPLSRLLLANIEDLGHGEELVLTGLTDDSADEAETQSTNTSAAEEMNERSFCSSGSDASKVQDEVTSRHHCVTAGDSAPEDKDNTPPGAIARLLAQNAELIKENELLKQQCLQVVKECRHGLDDSTPKCWPDIGAACKVDTTILQGQVVPEHQMQRKPQISPVGSGGSAPVPTMPLGGVMQQCIWLPWCGAQQMEPRMQVVVASSTRDRVAQPGTAIGTPMVSGNVSLQNQQTPEEVADRPESRAARAMQLFAKHAAVVAATKSVLELHARAPCIPSETSETSVPEDKEASPGTCPPDLPTSVMLRNLPNNYSKSMLLSLIDSEGFRSLYDFVYLPVDFTTKACLGYAFINLVDHDTAERFLKAFKGFNNWIIPSRKVCSCTWNTPHQGLEAQIERYRNSPVMHEAVPVEYKPVLFKDGIAQRFPPPNKKIRAPRNRPRQLNR
jgi:hypothetical protein